MRTLWIIVLVGCGLSAALAASFAWTGDAGTVACDGGTEDEDIDSAEAVPESGPEIKGKILNKLGKPMKGLRISVLTKGGSGTVHPDGTGEIGNGSTTLAPKDGAKPHPSGRGFTMRFDLSAAGDLDPLPNDSSFDFTIDQTANIDSTELEIRITPSDDDKPKGSNLHADVMASFRFSSDRYRATHVVEDSLSDRIVFDVLNVDRRHAITELAATVTGGTVEAIYLSDPANGYALVSGTSISSSGDTHTLTSFTELQDASTYEVVIVFDAALEGPVAVDLRATFAN